MSSWRDVGSGHLVQLLPHPSGGVTLLWEHDAPPGYSAPRHRVSSSPGATWQVLSEEPLTLSPSLHCDPARGGCGAHGHVRAGVWL